MSFMLLTAPNPADISIEPLVQIANGNQCSVKPREKPSRNASAFTQHPASSSKEPPEKVGGGVCARLNTAPPAPSATDKDPNGSVGDRGFEGVYSSRQPTEPPACGYGPPKATESCARPLSPARGPSQDFRPAATACKERHQMKTIEYNSQQRALHTCDTPQEGVYL